MNLIVTQRAEELHLRFEVRGRWEYNDALTLAYQVKAAGLRTGLSYILIDLREVMASPAVEGKFLVWDRLRRVLPSYFKVALLAPVGLVDLKERTPAGTASVVLFQTERAALAWLDGILDPGMPIKNPPVVERSEGQVAGKET
jgi:hypothetical protein